MIAGLPNDIGKITLLVLVSTIVLVFALPALAEDVQTPSTTLDDVLTLVTQNEYLSPTQQTLLTSALTSAVTSGALTVDQALALVDLSGLEDVTDVAETPVLTHALSIILNALASGEISPEQASTYMADTVESSTLSALKDLTQAETPMGIKNSISKLGTTEGYEQEAIDTVLAKVDELVVAVSVPSGIALRVAKDLLRAGLDPDQIAAELDRLETSIAEEGTSPGKAANEVTPQGQHQNQNQEEEMNQNTNQGKNDEPEDENEENQNGSSGNGKSSSSPNKGNSNNGNNGSSSNGNSSKGNSGNSGNKGGKN